MRDGHVWFRFGFRGEVEGTVVTANKYNTNQWTFLMAKRSDHEGTYVRIGTSLNNFVFTRVYCVITTLPEAAIRTGLLTQYNEIKLYLPS